METKSRFEVLKELNDKKESLLREKNGFDDMVKDWKKEIRNETRDLEDAKEELKEYENSLEEKKGYIDELIKATESSIKSLQEVSASKK